MWYLLVFKPLAQSSDEKMIMFSPFMLFPYWAD